MLALAMLTWTTLAVLVAVSLRIWLRPDVGFGAAGRHRSRKPVVHHAMPRSSLPE